MNRDDIIRMAREATDEPCPYDNGGVTWSFTEPELERFAALVAAAEREACARMCEAYMAEGIGREMAQTIRARGEVETKTPDYLEKCPNCNGPADNGFDRSWPDPNPYYCTKCMKAMEY